jgi:hypothetical protein
MGDARTRNQSTALFLAVVLLFWAPPVQAFVATHVVIVVIDGARDTECFEHPLHLYVPHIWNELRPQGYVSHAFYNQGTTETLSGHATIVAGTLQNLADDGSERPNRPMLWEYLRKKTGIPDRSTVFVTNKRKLLAISYSSYPGYGPTDSTYVIGPTWEDGLSLQRLLTHFATDRPRLAMITFAEPDGRAHGGSFDGYVRAIADVDSMTAYLWNWLQARPEYAGRTDLFFTGDHGRHRTDWTSHGDSCDGCRHLPFLALGPDFVSGVEATAPPADQRDIAMTAALILGISVEYGDGRVLTELLRDTSGLLPNPRLEANEGIRIWPSPAGSEINLRLAETTPTPGIDRWEIGLFDVAGRRLVRQEASPSELARGTPLTRPPGLDGSGVTYLELRPVPGSAGPSLHRPVVWVR